VNSDGVLDGAMGPISPNEAKHAKLSHWTFNPEEGEQLRRRFLEFERFTV
jgi:hypothetical protein